MKRAINTTPIIDTIVSQLEAKKMSQKELSDIIGVSTPVVNDILKNRRSLSPKQIVRISIILGLDAVELGRMQSDYEIMRVLQPIIDNAGE